MPFVSESHETPKALNPELVAFNARNAERNRYKTENFDRLLAQTHIAEIAYARQTERLEAMTTLCSQAEGIERIRALRTYEYDVFQLEPADENLIAAPHIAESTKYKKFRELQRRKASRTRELQRDNSKSTSMPSLIAELISKPERRDDTPSELFQHFGSLLEDNG